MENEFPVEFIASISEDFLIKIYNDNCYAEEVIVDSNVTYLDSNTNRERGNISEDDLAFWIVGAKIVNGGIVQHVNVYTFYDWNILTTSQADAVTVNWDSSLWCYDNYNSGFSASMTDAEQTYEILSRPAKINLGGIGWFCDVRPPAISTVEGEAYFKLFPTNVQMPNSNVNRTIITAEYGHRTISLTGITLGLTDVGVSFSNADEYAATSCSIYY